MNEYLNICTWSVSRGSYFLVFRFCKHPGELRYIHSAPLYTVYNILYSCSVQCSVHYIVKYTAHCTAYHTVLGIQFIVEYYVQVQCLAQLCMYIYNKFYYIMYIVLYNSYNITMITTKLWNRKPILKQYLNVFDVVRKQIVLLVTC